MSEYVVLYEHSEDGSWGAYLPDLAGVVALGTSREEVERLIREAVAADAKLEREQGAPIPGPAHQAGTLTL